MLPTREIASSLKSSSQRQEGCGNSQSRCLLQRKQEFAPRNEPYGRDLPALPVLACSTVILVSGLAVYVLLCCCQALMVELK